MNTNYLLFNTKFLYICEPIKAKGILRMLKIEQMNSTGWYKVTGRKDQKQREKKEIDILSTGASGYKNSENEKVVIVHIALYDPQEDKIQRINMTIEEVEKVVERLKSSIESAKKMKIGE